jgi:hypothetical protein
MPANDPTPPDYAAMASEFDLLVVEAPTSELAKGYRLIAEGYRTLARAAVAVRAASAFLGQSQTSA